MDTGYIMYLLSLALYSIGSVGVLLWFWWRVRPKFPSGLSTGIVVFFAVLVSLSINLILAFAMAPLTPQYTISLTKAFKVSITEETIKILIVALGLFIVREDSAWTDTKLTLALIAGLVFGIAEGFGYIFNRSYSHLGEIVLFLSRMFHPVLTVTLMAGLILLVKGRKLPGVLIAVSPYFTHAFIDYHLSRGNYGWVSAVFIASFVIFLAGIHLLLPAIDEEKRTRERFQREATVDIKDHWLNKM